MYKINLVFVFVSFVIASGKVKIISNNLDPTELDENHTFTQNVTSVLDYKLPEIYKVHEYVIFIDVYLEEYDDENKNFTFAGIVTINFELKNETNKIIFHKENLKLLDYNLKKFTGSFIDGLELREDPPMNFSIITRKNKENFTTGNYTLHIKYSGKLDENNNKRGGLFARSYSDPINNSTV